MMYEDSISHEDLLPEWGREKIWKSLKRPHGEVIGTRHKWGWIETFILEMRDGSQERRISVRLPIWGYGYSINNDEIRWAQLSFQYCGQRGCYLAPWFAPSDDF